MLPRRYAPLLLIMIAACSGGADRIAGPDAGASSPSSRVEVEPSPLFHTAGMDGADGALIASDGSVSFWAVRGQTRSASIRHRDGSSIVTFTIPAGALKKDHRGRRIAKGDSIRITMSLPDPSRFAVKMQPEGLRFDKHEPGILTFNLAHLSSDALNSGHITLWRQETPSGPWESVPLAVDYEARTATADIFGFTVYALSY